METKRERLWKAAVENASHSLRVYHNTLRTTAAPFGHGSLIGGGSNLMRIWHVVARWARGTVCRWR